MGRSNSHGNTCLQGQTNRLRQTQEVPVCPWSISATVRQTSGFAECDLNSDSPEHFQAGQAEDQLPEKLHLHL